MEKKNKNVLLTVMGMLIIGTFILLIATFEREPLTNVCCIAALVFIAVYGFFLYKKPHGNILKYAMLLFAFAQIFSSIRGIYVWGIELYPFYEAFITVLIAATVCYASGRLNRIDQNKYLFPIIDIVLLIMWIIRAISYIGDLNAMVRVLRYSRYFVMFTTLMIAYFVRYKEHKEAGLEDAPIK